MHSDVSSNKDMEACLAVTGASGGWPSFSRLEERKGIKVFVDALNMLDADALAVNQVTQPRQDEQMAIWIC